MRVIAVLVARNLRIYVRDRAGVLLSLLSAFVLLLLYLLFLGKIQVDNLKDFVPGSSTDDVGRYIGAWVYAGIVMITPITTGLAALQTYVDDKISGRFKEFRVSPIRRTQLILGYQLSAVLVAITMSTIVLIVGAAMVKIFYGEFAGWGGMAEALGLIVLISWVFGALSSFGMTFVNSTSSFTTVSTITGTLLGFLAGAYLPLGLLSKSVVNVINALPFSSSAMLLREPLAGRALDNLANGSEPAREAIETYYGHVISIGDTQIDPAWAIAGLTVLGLMFTVAGAVRIGRSIR
jgi:putative ABC-2 type transporter, integral membrane protein